MIELAKVQLDFAKSTPGTHVFKTEDPNAAISQQYIRKSAFPDGQVPRKIEITVSVAPTA